MSFAVRMAGGLLDVAQPHSGVERGGDAVRCASQFERMAATSHPSSSSLSQTEPPPRL